MSARSTPAGAVSCGVGRYARVPTPPGLHRLEEMLRLADAWIAHRIACPRRSCWAAERRFAGATRRRAVCGIHAAPNSPISAGRRTAGAPSPRARRRGLASSPPAAAAPAERAFLDELWARHAGAPCSTARSTWPHLTALLRSRAVYVGPDTSVTHLAAASRLPDCRPLRPDRSAACGVRCQRADWSDVGRPPERSSAAAMSGWCRIPALPAVSARGLRHGISSRSQCL